MRNRYGPMTSNMPGDTPARIDEMLDAMNRMVGQPSIADITADAIEALLKATAGYRFRLVSDLSVRVSEIALTVHPEVYRRLEARAARKSTP